MKRSCAVVMLLACSVGAQADERARLDLARMEAQLQQNRSDVERLLDLRMQHDLGLPVDRDVEQFRTEGPVATEALERQRATLQTEEQATATLLQRYGRLKASVEQLQREAAEQAARRKDDEWVTVPQPGMPAGRGAARSVDTQGAQPGAQPAGEVRASDAEGAPAAGAPEVRVVQNLDPVRGHIHGSDDHSRVSQALFKAAQALMDRAAELRRANQRAAADELDQQARERLQRALDELKPRIVAPNPAFVDLFCLGKCREALFRLAERHDGLVLRDKPKEYQQREQEVREPFLAIAARDVAIKKGIEQAGPWARAAQAALELFRWMNLHAGFRPKTAVESITWQAAQNQ